MTKTKSKVRKISIRLKIMIPIELIIIAICIIFGINSYQKIKNSMVSMGVEQAAMAADVAYAQVDGDLLEQIAPGSEGTEVYQTLWNSMQQTRKVCGIAYLYTIYTDGVNVYYGVDTDEEEPCYAGEDFGETYEDMAEVFEGQDFVQDYIDESEFGDLISAYKPIYNSEGKVVGVLGSDYDASDIVKRLNSVIWDVVRWTLISLVAASVVLILIVNRIVKSMRRVESKLYELVHKEGDLTQKLEVKTGDEMEVIAGDINDLLEYIKTIMLQIASESNNLHHSSKEVVSDLQGAEISITDVSATMEQMSTAMQETTASLNQMNEFVSNIYEALENMYNRAKQGEVDTDSIMKSAVKISDNAINSRAKAQEQVKVMSASINEKIVKSQAVEEINTLTSNIINITKQTNLLALNASIEAARAGDAGRGFAVVADEIGKLASNSATAAEGIRQISDVVIEAVNALAEEATNMINFMDETSMDGYNKLVENGEDYRENAESMHDRMLQFANACEKLKVNMGTIRETIDYINTAVEENTMGITNVTTKSMELNNYVSGIKDVANGNMDISEELNNEVNKFKLQ